MKNLANMITIARIVFSILLLFTVPFLAPFYICYTICGISDILDGFVARRTNTQSQTGAVLDSISDIVFLIAVMVKLFPFLISKMNTVLIVSLVLVAAIRIISYVIGYFRFKQFAALHTIENKITGGMLFLAVYLFSILPMNLIAAVLLLAAGLSAMEELLLTITMPSLMRDCKGVLWYYVTRKR